MIEKKRTTDNKKENLKFQKIAKKPKLQEAGITLIALVVTIIILLILAGVTLNIALSDNGLIKKSQEATEKYKQAQEDEEKSLSQIEMLLYSEGDFVGEYVTGYEPTVDPAGCTIEGVTSGTGATQKFYTEIDTEEASNGIKWRIWDYDGEKLTLISDRPTEAQLTLKNVNGYNNGIWAMNEICRKCYTDSNIPAEDIEVRNLRRSDIEAVSNYDYTQYKHTPSSSHDVTEDGNDLIHYGSEKTYTEFYKAPKMYTDHDISWTYKYDTATKTGTGEKSCWTPWEQEYKSSTETEFGSTNPNTSFKQSFYAHFYENSEFNNSKYYDLIFRKGDGSYTSWYWLANRDICLYGTYCNFDLGIVESKETGCSIYGTYVCNSGGDGVEKQFPLRPIVSIDLKSSGYKLVQNDDPSEAKFKITNEAE